MAGNREYHCDTCNRDFSSQQELEQHARQEHQQQGAAGQQGGQRDQDRQQGGGQTRI
jgi:hypothetical protein